MRVRELSIPEIEAYQEEGVSFLPQLVDRVTVSVLRAAAERRAAALEEEMQEAAGDLRFEYAARLRDEVKELKRELRDMR